MNQPPDRQSVARELDLERLHASGSRWFYWIAALSLVNSIAAMSNSDFGFVIGLGMTQFIDGIALALAKGASGDMVIAAKACAFVADLVVSGLFVLFGAFARKGHDWAFMLGMICYGADALLYVLTANWIAIGFHGLALFFIYRGMQAHKQLAALRAAGQGSAA